MRSTNRPFDNGKVAIPVAIRNEFKLDGGDSVGLEIQLVKNGENDG